MVAMCSPLVMVRYYEVGPSFLLIGESDHVSVTELILRPGNKSFQLRFFLARVRNGGSVEAMKVLDPAFPFRIQLHSCMMPTDIAMSIRNRNLRCMPKPLTNATV